MVLFWVFFLSPLFAAPLSLSGGEDQEPQKRGDQNPKIKREARKKKPTPLKDRKSLKLNISSCLPEGLRNKDCYLSAFNYNIYFGAEKIRLSDGRWRSLVDMPKHGKGVEWHAIRLFEKNQRFFLEFFLWALQEYGKVQSLFWDIYEIKGIQMKKVLSEIVQKRRKNITDWKNIRYIYDKKVNHGLKALKDGKIQWFVKNKKGVF